MLRKLGGEDGVDITETSNSVWLECNGLETKYRDKIDVCDGWFCRSKGK